jgi:DNA-binding NtrC family response regulator
VIRVRNMIVFVEDEALLHLDVEAALVSAGFCVASALCLLEVTEVLATRPQEICALITDVDLGDGFSGWELARRARQAIPGLPVIYASGHGHDDFPAEAVADAKFVGKPYAPDHLVRVACALLATA